MFMSLCSHAFYQAFSTGWVLMRTIIIILIICALFNSNSRTSASSLLRLIFTLYIAIYLLSLYYDSITDPISHLHARFASELLLSSFMARNFPFTSVWFLTSSSHSFISHFSFWHWVNWTLGSTTCRLRLLISDKTRAIELNKINC